MCAVLPPQPLSKVVNILCPKRCRRQPQQQLIEKRLQKYTTITTYHVEASLLVRDLLILLVCVTEASKKENKNKMHAEKRME